uniref:Cryptic/Cripto CFC domain-containing protein n=1 Tax=Malurus cyaneus samueli TaxID=2593467 RepID=A0A8C5U5Y0_9PASS
VLLRTHMRISSFQTTLPFHVCASCQGREKEEHKEDVKSLNATAQKQQLKNEGAFINALSDMNQSYESRKQQSSRSFVPFTGITESKKLKQTCCQNGGTCILGLSGVPNVSLVIGSNCGSIAHGVWVLKGCWLCRCGYGTLNCLSEVMYNNCELPSAVAAYSGAAACALVTLLQ